MNLIQFAFIDKVNGKIPIDMERISIDAGRRL